MKGKAATALLLACLSGCGPQSRAPAPGDAQEAAGQVIVLLTIDTWRWDANTFLGGADPSPTPFLDALAGRGRVFTDAWTPVPLTGPAHWAALNGRWPWADGLRNNLDRPREPHPGGLASSARDGGSRTAAFVSAAVLDRRGGFAEGFELFDDTIGSSAGEAGADSFAERRGAATVDRALDWVSARGPAEKLFLWVHLFDPHYPYEAPAATGSFGRRTYLGEVAYVDRQCRRLAEGLEGAGRPPSNTLWIVTSDHGEALGDHGEVTHGLLLHSATTRIPLFMTGPGIPPGRDDAPASLVDIPVTVSALSGWEIPAGDGLDLLGNSPGRRSLPMESIYGAEAFGLSAVTGLREAPWLWEASPADHLWRTGEEGGEDIDLAGREEQRVREMRKRRASFPLPGERGIPGGEERARLRSLGYLGGGRAGSGDVRRFAAGGLALLTRARGERRGGGLNEAQESYAAFLREYPKSPGVCMEAGMLAWHAGNGAGAEEYFRRAIALDPGLEEGHLNLAGILAATGRTLEAEKEFREALVLHPEDADALYGLAALMMEEGRGREARPVWERFLALRPDDPEAPKIRAALRAGGR